MYRRLRVVISGKIINLRLERQVVGRVSRNVAIFVLDGHHVTYPFLPELREFTQRKILQEGDTATISGENRSGSILCFSIRDDSSGNIISKTWLTSFLTFIFIMIFTIAIHQSSSENLSLKNFVSSPKPKIEMILTIISLYFLFDSFNCYRHRKNVSSDIK